MTVNWNAVGAIATAIAIIVALGGYGFLEWQRRAALRLSRRTNAHMIGVRTARLLNVLVDLQTHFERFPKTDWRKSKSLLPPVHPLIGNSTDAFVRFERDEIALLIEMKEADFLQEMMLIAARVDSITLSMHEYAKRYDELYRMLPSPVSMKGAIATHGLGEEEVLRFRPYSIILFELIYSIDSMITENISRMRALAENYHPMMKRRFPKEKFISLSAPE